MEKSMMYYIDHMASSNLKKFKKLVSCHYRKFVCFYYLVEEYSGIISRVKYEFQNPEKLDVELIFKTKRKLEKICEELEASISENGYDATVSCDKKSIFMSLTMEEEPEPEEEEEDES